MTKRDAHGVLCGYTSEVTEALDMAIEALSAPQNNLISREDAVKTVIRKCSPICDWQVGTQQYPDCVVAEINALPSAEVGADMKGGRE